MKRVLQQTVVENEFLRHMNNDDPKGFHALTQILSAFQRDRSHPDSQFLIFYIKFCALRHDGEDQFHNKLLTQWNKYLNDEPFTQKRPDFFCCWFLFELLVKSILLCKDQSSIDYPSIVTLTSTLSSYLPRFRDSGQNIGAISLFAEKNIFILVQKPFCNAVCAVLRLEHEHCRKYPASSTAHLVAGRNNEGIMN